MVNAELSSGGSAHFVREGAVRKRFRQMYAANEIRQSENVD
jgi:hypothetical protein